MEDFYSSVCVDLIEIYLSAEEFLCFIYCTMKYM